MGTEDIVGTETIVTTMGTEVSWNTVAVGTEVIVTSQQ
jgi:hypothetical protein